MNIWQQIRLVLLMCGVAGFMTIPSSILGGALIGDPGVFVGAVIGGLVGVLLAGWLACRLGWLTPAHYRATVAGGVVGFGLAAVIAGTNLHTPVIPLLSSSLIGLGALAGNWYAGRG
ncbi:MAG: hypothetical protein L0332_00135 [Chloroflexi bacterium]|nr:hypothetical protein [Chloroflexota bacterium]MCI0579573.1 hypothetical protein [Chloroflexota bacterium]MCI0644328.1 hypothetical protein [Chloroflexota bacterium]MCI0725131.1 hypothetical protein [Chloroflexota bacterium]